MSVLVPCPSCARHIRGSETSCPFCGATTHGLLDSAPREAPRGLDPRRSLSRAALALASIAAVTACGKTTSSAYGGPPPTMADAAPPAPNTESPSAPAYGGPPPMLTADAAAPSPRTIDGGAPPKPAPTMQNIPAPAYGGPPPKLH